MMKKIFLILVLVSAAPIWAAGNCKGGCIPPATYTFTKNAFPFNTPVDFGGEINRSGQIQWLWIKKVEFSHPCTDEMKNEKGAYGYACGVKVGEPLFTTLPQQLP